MYSKQDIYAIPKLPLAEYLIGKYIADDAFRHPHSPLLLIEAFRKWIWRPDRHDVLDYAFDALWNRSRGTQPGWADALLGWAKEVGKWEPADCDEGWKALNDDWLHPFAIVVLRGDSYIRIRQQKLLQMT